MINLFIPTLVLGVLNCLVYRSLKNSTTIGNQLRRSGRGEEAMRKRDIRLTRIAIAIVGVFIACHLPRFIPNIVEMVTSMPQVKKKIYLFFSERLKKVFWNPFYVILIFFHDVIFVFQWFAIIISVNSLLQIINCTVNYIIYFGHCWKEKRSSGK